MSLVEVTLRLHVEVGDEDALRDAGFKALRARQPDESGVESATVAGDHHEAALAGYLASTPGAVALRAPGVAGARVVQCSAKAVRPGGDGDAGSHRPAEPDAT